MTRDETVALFLQGREAWNTWAEGLLAERKALEASGAWKSRRSPDPWELEKGENPETQTWLDKAFADFSRCLFLVRGAEGSKETAGEAKKKNEGGGRPVKSIQLKEECIYFDRFVFPSYSRFDSATFTGTAWFNSAAFTGTASFERATFTDTAWFNSATFTDTASFQRAAFTGTAWFNSATFTDIASFERAAFTGTARFERAAFTGTAQFERAAFTGNAWFISATFTGYANFESAAFTGTASFEPTTFTGDARFNNTAFTGDASFNRATFTGTARFERAAFSGDAYFRSATFSGDANFPSATFKNSTTFGQAKFQKGASFTGIKVERAFDMTGAKFAKVPAFNQADFKQSPDLDAVDFPLPGFWRRGEAGLIPHYRAIRRMAIQGADYEREQMAFKGETRSKRGTEHKPWHTAFWFGIAYDAFSDFGRSIARPLGIWFASWLAFAAIYAWNAGVAVSGWASACADDGASKALKALTLSAANSLPLIGSSRGEVAQEFYTKCLALTHLPAWSPILQIWQTLWSAVLLFLFLLALRNQFKIK